MKIHDLGNTDAPKPRRWVRWLVELSLFLVIIFGVRTWQQRGMLDGAAPTFEHTALNGQVVKLADYRGKPVLLHFWASWCPMCEMEQGSISNLAKEAQVITVAYQSGGADEVKRYLEREQINDWVTVVDDDGKLSEQYGIRGVPTTYVLDANGNIRFHEVGISSEWGLRIRLWLAGLLY